MIHQVLQKTLHFKLSGEFEAFSALMLIRTTLFKPKTSLSSLSLELFEFFGQDAIE
jgi:hypothetical protein